MKLVLKDQARKNSDAGTPLQGDLVDREQAARLLGVSARTLDRWHLLREGPPRVRIGRLVRYRISSIQTWIIKNETTPMRGVAERPETWQGHAARSPDT